MSINTDAVIAIYRISDASLLMGNERIQPVGASLQLLKRTRDATKLKVVSSNTHPNTHNHKDTLYVSANTDSNVRRLCTALTDEMK